MATKIVTKNSSTASAVPTASDLVQGELAVNVADKRLFTEDNGGAIVELGTNPSGNVTFQDNGKAIFGAGSDLQIYHDGSNSKIENSTGYTKVSSLNGVLYLDGNDVRIRSGDGGETGAKFIDNGASELYYDNAKKLATTSTGIDVTGTATMDGLTVDGGAGNSLVNLTPSGTYSTVVSFANAASAFDIVSYGSGSASADNFRIRDNGASRLNIAGNGDISFYEDTGTTAKLFWDASAESLGIGTSSPAYELDVKSSGEADIRIDSATGNDGALRFAENGTNVFTMYHDAANSALAFYDNANTTERMRIDSSGNLLVGSTSDSGTDYHYLKSDGFVRHKRAGGIVGVFDRGTSDGDIVLFRKDGSTVGSIGSAYRGASGDSLYFVAGDTGIVASPSDDSIVPVTTNGAGRDAAINLGTSSTRFKDLYLSGGVYLGGTGAANKLDDYEEGTFSGTAAGSVYSGTYTKVGRICHISMTIDNTNSTGTQLASLPFSSKNGGTSFNGSQPTFNSSSTQAGFYVAPYNGGAALFGYSRLGATINISSGSIAANFTYETD